MGQGMAGVLPWGFLPGSQSQWPIGGTDLKYLPVLIQIDEINWGNTG